MPFMLSGGITLVPWQLPDIKHFPNCQGLSQPTHWVYKHENQMYEMRRMCVITDQNSIHIRFQLFQQEGVEYWDMIFRPSREMFHNCWNKNIHCGFSKVIRDLGILLYYSIDPILSIQISAGLRAFFSYAQNSTFFHSTWLDNHLVSLQSGPILYTPI